MLRDCGDVIDRASISRLKFERIGTKENDKEFHAFQEGVKEIKEKYLKVNWDQFCELMYAINSTIWFLEASLKGDKNILPNPHHLDDKSNREVLASIGKNTILIRNVNNLRVKVKNIINTITKTGFQDIKSKHLSE